jgi:hypothetical protein
MDRFVIKMTECNGLRNIAACASKNSNVSAGPGISSATGIEKDLPAGVRLCVIFQEKKKMSVGTI